MKTSALIYSTSKNRSSRCALCYSCTTLYLDIRYIVLFIVLLQRKNIYVCVSVKRGGGEGVQKNYFGPSGLSLV